MIYLFDDYFDKYISVFSYLFERSCFEKYSYSFIERKIAYSLMVNELERSNITTIAFSSNEMIYNSIFPNYVINDFKASPYNIYGWLGFLYVHLFIDLKITWEMLFILLPIKKAISMYNLYHEMDYRQSLDYVKSLFKYSNLNLIMEAKSISTNELASTTNIPVSTIRSLRYGIRDINKLAASSLHKIANKLDVKIESLLSNIQLIVG